MIDGNYLLAWVRSKTFLPVSPNTALEHISLAHKPKGTGITSGETPGNLNERLFRSATGRTQSTVLNNGGLTVWGNTGVLHRKMFGFG